MKRFLQFISHLFHGIIRALGRASGSHALVISCASQFTCADCSQVNSCQKAKAIQFREHCNNIVKSGKDDLESEVNNND